MEILIIGVILVVVLSSIRQINEYERGIKFRFGKFKKIMYQLKSMRYYTIKYLMHLKQYLLLKTLIMQ